MCAAEGPRGARWTVDPSHGGAERSSGGGDVVSPSLIPSAQAEDPGRGRPHRPRAPGSPDRPCARWARPRRVHSERQGRAAWRWAPDDEPADAPDAVAVRDRPRIGSAREIARLTTNDDAFRFIVGARRHRQVPRRSRRRVRQAPHPDGSRGLQPAAEPREAHRLKSAPTCLATYSARRATLWAASPSAAPSDIFRQPFSACARRRRGRTRSTSTAWRRPSCGGSRRSPSFCRWPRPCP